MAEHQNSRRERTRQRLMAAGEQMIGQRGIDGVSLEEIARAAGAANKYAVQYHFGSRQGLVQEILDTRLRAIERRRAELIAGVAPGDVAGIIGALVLPIVELGREDDCAFPRFLLQFATQFQPWPDIVHPLEKAGSDTATMTLFRQLCAALPHVPAQRLGARLMMLMHLPLQAIVAGAGRPGPDDPAGLRDLIAMMAAALAVPAD